MLEVEVFCPEQTESYGEWKERNQRGYVINAMPKYGTLHRADCKALNNWYSRPHPKMCSTSESALRMAWLRETGREAVACGYCRRWGRVHAPCIPGPALVVVRAKATGR